MHGVDGDLVAEALILPWQIDTGNLQVTFR
jgi:hypothetical protein